VAAARADAGLITAFPWRLPLAAIEAFPLGLFNAHPGLLPEYRGAAPIFWQIRRGAVSAGITLHRVDAGLDTGPVFDVSAVPLVPWETHGIHVSRLEGLVGPLALRLADALTAGTAMPLTPQDSSATWPCRRPGPADLAVRWLEDYAPSIQRLANACNGAYDGPITSLGGALWRLVVVTVVPGSGPSTPPGTVVRADAREGVLVACQGGAWLRLDVVTTREGTLTGGHLVALGLTAGARFDPLPPTVPPAA
jgi:methionyl-tRNA formyltransferase